MEVLTTATLDSAPRRLNGGFPEPYARLSVRLVRVNHRACGEGTMIRIPVAVPAEAIRHVVCSGCQQEFEPQSLQPLGILDAASRAPAKNAGAAYNSVPMRERPSELATLLENAYVNQPTVGPGTNRRVPEKPARRRPRVAVPSISVPRPTLPKLPRPSLPKPSFSMPRPRALASVSLPRPTLSRPSLPKLRLPRLGRGDAVLPSYAAIPIAFAAVVVGIIAIQNYNSSTRLAQPEQPAQTTSTPSTTAPATSSTSQAASGNAKVVRGSNFTLALPAGWKQTTPPSGATFAAASTDGTATATLWIQNEPSLDYPTFEAQSLQQLRSLAGSAHIANRVVAPTPEGTIVHLAADTPAGQPTYDATLRVSGPYRYYLATSVEPTGSAVGKQGAELLANSLTPVADGVAK